MKETRNYWVIAVDGADGMPLYAAGRTMIDGSVTTTPDILDAKRYFSQFYAAQYARLYAGRAKMRSRWEPVEVFTTIETPL